MNVTKPWVIFLTIFMIGHVNAYNISGVIKDSAGNGIEGAIMRLGIADISTITGSDGNFTLTDNSSAIKQPNPLFNNTKYSFKIEGHRLSFNTKVATCIEISTYGIDGKCLDSYKKNISPGTHSTILPQFTHGMHRYKITLNNEQFAFKSVAGDIKNIASIQNVIKRNQSKVSDVHEKIDDALLVHKNGYNLCRIPISNPDTSGINLTLVPLITGTVTDANGNEYQTVTIGNQEWMIENLRTTKFNDGTDIPLVTDSATWGTTASPGYCFYNNTTDNDTIKKWGALYNWYSVNTGKLAPLGWHVPTDAEWDTLQNYLIANGHNYDGSSTENLIAIAMASTTDWVTFEVVGAPGKKLNNNNSSGFSALPGGHRSEDGIFDGKGFNAHWWCTTEFDETLAYDHEIYYYFWYLGRLPLSKNFGSSVRLIRDK